MYYVYIHTLPNGKIYIGQTKDIKQRWNNGEGYLENKPFYKDIKLYGWNNIKHEIIAQYPTRESALQLESALIVLLKAENDNYGYNQTSIYNDAMSRYVARVPYDGISLENGTPDNSFFEVTGLPVSACNELIEQWIFNKEHREILKSRLIDGASYQKLSEMYNKSIRQIKTIVYSGCSKIEKHT